MPTYRAKFGDQIISIDADSPQQAAMLARLKFAGQEGVSRAEAGAVERSNAPDLTGNPTQILAKSRERTAEGLPGYATVGGLGVIGGAAAPGLALGMLKDAGIYGAAEGAEKMFGLPSWTGEAVGAVSPARQAMKLGKLLLGGAFGAGKGVAAEAAAGVEGAAVKKAVEETAERAAARRLKERALDLAEKRLAQSERKLVIMESRAAGKAARPPKVAVEAPTPPTVPSAAPVAPTAPPVASAPVPETSEIVLKLQQQMGTSEGRKVVRELISQMPKEQGDMIKKLLMRGQEHPATVLGKLFDPTKSAVGRAAKPGEELARLLGQIP